MNLWGIEKEDKDTKEKNKNRQEYEYMHIWLVSELDDERNFKFAAYDGNEYFISN